MSAENPTVREWLTENLAPLLPEDWKWVDNERAVDVTEAVTVRWAQRRIAPLAETPLSHLGVEGILTVFSPRIDTERAEDELDDAVLELVYALQSLQGVKFTEATKVAVDEQQQRLGYDLQITVITNKKEA